VQLKKSYIFLGCSTNDSESFNAILKRSQDRADCPLDVMVLRLLQTCSFLQCEARRAMHGCGSWKLSETLSIDIPEVDPLTTLKPEDLRRAIRNATSEISPDKTDNPARHLLPTIIADRAIKENRVVLCGAAKCFVVIGESSEKYTVSVHPVLHCSCPAKKNCWHIKAVLRCIGYDDAVCTGVLSFSELFRKRRARKGIGSSGRKAPRIGDVDTVVLSAPDASNKQKVTRSNRARSNRGYVVSLEFLKNTY
jgi:hypothetical protein